MSAGDKAFSMRGGAAILRPGQPMPGARDWGSGGVAEWPLGRLHIDDGGIVIGLLMNEHVIPRVETGRITIGTYFLGRKSVHIRFGPHDARHHAYFWPTLFGLLSVPLRWRMSAIHGELVARGYDVEIDTR